MISKPDDGPETNTDAKKHGIRVKIRNWKTEDLDELVRVQVLCYPDFADSAHYNRRIFELQLKSFPQGQFLAEYKEKIIGYTATLIVALDDDEDYSYNEITGHATFLTHNPTGDTLYGADMAVLPDYRGMGIAKKLYAARKKILKTFNLRRMVAGGRIPGYIKYAGKMTAEEYIEQVVVGNLTDPTLTPQLKSGYSVRGVFMDYLNDTRSLNYATYLEFLNPDYNPARRKIAASPRKRVVRKIRICAAQYAMRRVRGFDEMAQQVEFFVNTADQYTCHFLIFPELFTAQLVSAWDPAMEAKETIVKLTGFEERYIELFTGLAVEKNLHIIGGSTPVMREGRIKNVAHMFTPQGGVYTQEKIHITPHERKYWGIVPGDGLTIFDTGLARIAIQICYDIEFPEVSRLLARAGAEVIFIPFSTDDKKAYLRVRNCAQARAVENYIYTVIAGNTGNLPQVKSFIINYGQSAVFTPSDFPFPKDAVLAEASTTDETVVICDLDLSNLTRHRETGSVKPFHDSRPDLYELRSTQPIKMIKTY